MKDAPSCCANRPCRVQTKRRLSQSAPQELPHASDAAVTRFDAPCPPHFPRRRLQPQRNDSSLNPVSASANRPECPRRADSEDRGLSREPCRGCVRSPATSRDSTAMPVLVRDLKSHRKWWRYFVLEKATGL